MIDFSETLRSEAIFLITTIVGVVFASLGIKKRGYLFYGIGCIFFLMSLASGPRDFSTTQGKFNFWFSLITLLIGAALMILIGNKDEIRSAIGKKTAAKGWETLTVEEKGRIISSREPFKVRYKPKYDNIYLKLFAEHDEKNIPDDLMRAFDLLHEAKWSEARDLFYRISWASYYEPSPYPYFGIALSYMQINTPEDIAKNIGMIKYRQHSEYERAVEIGGAKFTEAIERLVSSSSQIKQ